MKNKFLLKKNIIKKTKNFNNNFLFNNFEYFKLYIYNLKYSKLLNKKLLLKKKNLKMIIIVFKLFFFNKNLNLSFLLKKNNFLDIIQSKRFAYISSKKITKQESNYLVKLIF